MKFRLAIVIAITIFALLVAGCAPKAAPAPTPAPTTAPTTAPTAAPTQVPTPAPEQEVIKWRCQDISPPASESYNLHEAMLREIERLSDGRLEIELYAPGALCPDLDTFDAAIQGQFEMGISSPGYHRDTIPEIEAANPPLAYRNLTDLLLVYYNYGLKDFYTESYAQNGLHLLDLAACRGVFLISTKPVYSVEDLSKLKIRTHTTYAQFVEQLGASTLYIPGGEVYTGLATGTADAATWGSEQTLYEHQWYEVAPYLVYPGLLDAMLSYDTFVNQEAWDKLPPDIQGIVHSCTTNYLMTQNYLIDIYGSVSAVEKMKEEGLECTYITDDDYPQMVAAAEAVWDSIAVKSPRSKEAMKLITDYLRFKGYTDYKID